MEQAILLLHLAIVIFLIALVLLQRSEGGALGMGGGGGGVVTGRGAASALSKVTWYLAVAFLTTSLTLTVMAQADRRGGSVLDNAPAAATTVPEGSESGDINGILDSLAPPTIGDENAPTTPPVNSDDADSPTPPPID